MGGFFGVVSRGVAVVDGAFLQNELWLGCSQVESDTLLAWPLMSVDIRLSKTSRREPFVGTTFNNQSRAQQFQAEYGCC